MVPTPAREVLGGSRRASEIIEEHVTRNRAVGRPDTAETVGKSELGFPFSFRRFACVAWPPTAKSRAVGPQHADNAKPVSSVGHRKKPSPRTVAKAMVGLKAKER